MHGRHDKTLKIYKLQENTMFATGNVTFKLQGKDKEIITISLRRDLFGSILFLSLKQTIDMGEVLKYLLTQVPLSASNVEGSMGRTSKSKLLQELESRVAFVKSVSMFFLHLLVDPSFAFGSVA